MYIETVKIYNIFLKYDIVIIIFKWLTGDLTEKDVCSKSPARTNLLIANFSGIKVSGSVQWEASSIKQQENGRWPVGSRLIFLTKKSSKSELTSPSMVVQMTSAWSMIWCFNLWAATFFIAAFLFLASNKADEIVSIWFSIFWSSFHDPWSCSELCACSDSKLF